MSDDIEERLEISDEDDESSYTTDDIDPIQDIREEDTLTSESEWSSTQVDFNLHHWNNLSLPIKRIMNEILKFTTSAQLSESNLESMLQLIGKCANLVKEAPQEDFSQMLTLNGFYGHYNLNCKTKKIHYCRECKDFQHDNQHTHCSCEKIWQKDDYLFWRPLEYAFQERIAFEPNFINETLNYQGHNDSSTISDRQGGEIFRKIHQPWIDETISTKRLTGTLNGDGVSPFKKSLNNFYNFIVQFNEMSPSDRKKSTNNFLWAILPRKPDKIDIEIGLKVIMNDLNCLNSNQKNLNLEMIIERVIADLPARSEILFFKRQGFYFCHLCNTKGEDTSGSHKVYPLEFRTRLVVLNGKSELIEVFEKFKYREYHNEISLINNFPNSNLPPGMDSVSPILLQPFNPNPTCLCSYDNMHYNYEGILVKFLNLIDERYWKEFDVIYLKQKFPSFFHKHPRSIAKNINHLKSIEVYILCHYYLELFEEIPSYSEIQEIVQHIIQYVRIIDKLMDSFQLEDLPLLQKQLNSVLYFFQKKDANFCSPNFHIAAEMVMNCRLYGPLWCNNAFIFEAMNNILSKPFKCANSLRYSILFFDMVNLVQLLNLKPPNRKLECVCGNYIINSKRDYLLHTPSKEIYQVNSFSPNYSQIEIRHAVNGTTITVSQDTIKQDFIPAICQQINGSFHFKPIHKMAFTLY
ncbi:predicted protein [Naegleria gruberi]|uniref:Predicted protein n=1 Tax=Naegleria gruberi TaxID=5762 RepID=D2W4Y0_NAEGR|nr:uncharacterized protein NAEGRDRAFT_54699 [Naegleria gruberi]EFC35875.1 predicted protein [Naegleria gruberi]|eukprot:XP_002668619.1 predicted protein [Naegleria gruberi strain NEG-M]